MELRAASAFYTALQDAACPAGWVEGGAGGPPPLGASKLDLGEWGRLDQLLRWFSKGLAADPQAELVFSPRLTKAQRASVHGTTTAVARDSLGTASRGMGEARAVVVLAKERAQRPVLDAEQEQRALWLWKWAGEEGQQVSRDEVREAVLAGSLPPPLQAVGERREAQQAAVRALVAAAAAGDEARLKELVAERPDLLADKVFDVHTGAAPLHAAAHAGQVAALDLLLAAGADINSTDGHGATALEISRRYDQSDTEGALLRAGAADPDASKWPGARRIDLAGADGANTAAAGEKTAAAGEKAATAGDKAAAAQSAAQPAVQPAAETAAPPAAAPEPLAAHPPPVAVHVPEAAESEEGGDESGSGTEEEEEVMTSTAAAAEEAVVAFSAALAAAEAAEAAAEEAEGMPGEEAAQRAAAFRKEAEAAIVAAAAAAVMAGDSLDAVLPPRPGSPDNEPEGDSVAPLPPAVPHFAVASSSVASVCGSEGPAMSIDTAEFTSLASQGEVVSQADAPSAAASAAERAEGAFQAELASADDSASVASAVSPSHPAGARSTAAAADAEEITAADDEGQPAAGGSSKGAAAAANRAAGAGGSGSAAAGLASDGKDAAAAGSAAAAEPPADGNGNAAAGLQAVAAAVAEQAAAAGKQAAAVASDAAQRARAELQVRLPEWKAWAEEHPGSVVAGASMAAVVLAAVLMLRK